MIAALSHKTFNERVLQVPEYMGGRKVLAALVMKKGGTDSRGTVICLGTGIVVVYVLVFLVFFCLVWKVFKYKLYFWYDLLALTPIEFDNSPILFLKVAVKI